ncbi:MAG: hypothetical protein ACJ786_11900 [Catenulispora sp.]
MDNDELQTLGLPDLDDPRLRRLRQLFLTIVTGGCAVMVPWIVYLAYVLPDVHPAKAWAAAWVGFDVLLVFGLLFTTWAAWRRRQIVVMACICTGTLLICDAWFDIVLDWGTRDEFSAILSAVFGEIPLACYLVHTALRILRHTMRSAFFLIGHTGPIPAFHKMSVGALAEVLESRHAARENA